MMTASERAEINRRNARKSTGPSPEARLRTRFNAVKHGCRAQLPVLPGEDPQAYQDRLDAWIGKFGPADDVERYLVERAVIVSWKLDRADRAEAAQLAAELDKEGADRERAVARLGAELFRAPGRGIGRSPGPDAGRSVELLSAPFDPADPDHPSRLVSALEATAAGCAWLRDQWAELGQRLDEGKDWRPEDRLRAIRMLGRQPLDVIADEPLLTIYLACHAMDPQGPDVFAEPLSDLYRAEDEATRNRLAGQFAAARESRAPRDAAEGRAVLRTIVAPAVDRAESLRQALAAAESAAVVNISARLTYQAKVSAEWLRKQQDTCSRALYRSFDELRKLRRDFGGDASVETNTADPTVPDPCADRAEAAAPSLLRLAPNTLSTWVADVTPAPLPCQVVEMATLSLAEPVGPADDDVARPQTIEETGPMSDVRCPLSMDDVRTATNEASAPAEPPAATTDHGPRTTDQTNEAGAPAEPSPAALDNGQVTGDETNEANTPAESTGRLLPVVRTIAMFLLIILSAGLAAAFAAPVHILGPDPWPPHGYRPAPRDAARSNSPGPVPIADAQSPGGRSGDLRHRIPVGRATSSAAPG